jgi:DNA-binding Xre family transcriptional regulator
MKERRVGRFIFRCYDGDLSPWHVHVLLEGREVGRWDLEHRRPMDSPQAFAGAFSGEESSEGKPERVAGDPARTGGSGPGRALRISAVDYAHNVGAIVFLLDDGRILAVPLRSLPAADATSVTAASTVPDGYAAVVEQKSGNRFDVPWDVVLQLADPAYPYRVNAGGLHPREIGERIRRERRSRDWTLAELSIQTGIRIPNLSRLETGSHAPSIQTLDRVAEALAIPVAELIVGRGPEAGR